MVGAYHLRQDIGIVQMGLEVLRDEVVIDSPADVPGSRATEIAPPGIVAISLSEHSECIYETVADYVVYPLPFFGGKSFFAGGKRGETGTGTIIKKSLEMK